MKTISKRKRCRIALISFAAAASVLCGSVTAYATQTAAPPVRVLYTGGGTASSVAVENAENLDTFKNLMPGGSTKPQNITIVNKGNQNVRVYFQAVPSDVSGQKLLDALDLSIDFRMSDSSGVVPLYRGKASGTSGGKPVSDVTKQIPLGFVYANSETGLLTATLTAPETMGNEYRNAQAKITWVIVFEVTDAVVSTPKNYNGGGGGGGGGGTPAQIESIAPESTPQAGPSSAPEEIPNEAIPLSNPSPKTGQDSTVLWGVLAAATAAGTVFVLFRRKIRHGE